MTANERARWIAAINDIAEAAQRAAASEREFSIELIRCAQLLRQACEELESME